MIQLEHDRTGRDYSLNLKAYNPGVVDGTGVFMASYLQALTKRLAVGSEVIYQRPNTEIEEANMSYMAKYVGGAERDWIATAQLLGGQGVVQGTYWQRLSDRVEAGAEITLAPHPSPRERKASATLAAKYDFRLASLRAQLDSTGKVSAYLEQRFTPAFSFLVTGEIDHVKNTSKWGVGIQLESSTMDEAEAQAQAQQAASSGFKPPV
jgi:mitochondrial import receptor subunit TOM40